MKRFSEYLYKRIDKRIVITVCIVFVLFVMLVMPVVSRYTAEVTNNADSPDLSLFYKADDLYNMGENYGQGGRNAYVILRFTFDLVFPVLYLSFLLVTTTFFAKKLDIKSKLKYLITFPILAASFDILENISTATVIGRYPKESIFFAHVAPYATLIKWIFVSLSFLLAAVLFLLMIVRHIKNKQSA